MRLTYDNVKNGNKWYTNFELNYKYHQGISWDEDANSCSKFKVAI